MLLIFHAYFPLYQTTKDTSHCSACFLLICSKTSNEVHFKENWAILWLAQIAFHLTPWWVMSTPGNPNIPGTPQTFVTLLEQSQTAFGTLYASKAAPGNGWWVHIHWRPFQKAGSTRLLLFGGMGSFTSPGERHSVAVGLSTWECSWHTSWIYRHIHREKSQAHNQSVKIFTRHQEGGMTRIRQEPEGRFCSLKFCHTHICMYHTKP